MTAEEILHKHISKECMDELSKNVWPDMLDAMEEYAQQQVKKCDLADVVCWADMTEEPPKKVEPPKPEPVLVCDDCC